jgi:hypothetical protein
VVSENSLLNEDEFQIAALVSLERVGIASRRIIVAARRPGDIRKVEDRATNGCAAR